MMRPPWLVCASRVFRELGRRCTSAAAIRCFFFKSELDLAWYHELVAAKRYRWVNRGAIGFWRLRGGLHAAGVAVACLGWALRYTATERHRAAAALPLCQVYTRGRLTIY
jgi:anti-sigma-K factor RskA